MIANEALVEILRTVKDPEVPVLDVVELGIVRDVRREGGRIVVEITPTYSGCPALKTIEDDIVAALNANGYRDVEVNKVYSPAWTTDWLTGEAKEKLRAYGIAPPQPDEATIACPQSGARESERISRFGSTPCKELRRCTACKEPFDHFKCH